MMNDLISNINKHKNEKNHKLCEELIDLIERYNFNSIEEIEKNEIDHFTLARPNGSIRMSDEEVLNRLFRYLSGEEFYESLENCSPSNQAMIDLLKKEFQITKSIEQKYLNIINIFAMLDWDIFLPYHTYKYIMEGKI